MPQHSGSSATGPPSGLDASRLAVAGDSVGGNMAAALTVMAKQRGDVRFVHQSLYYPAAEITVSPPRASTDELAGLPEAFVRYNGSSTASTAAVEHSIHILRKELGQ